VLAAVGVGGWTVYRCVAVSLQAERNLHATRFTMLLLEQFVAEKGRWPRSWEELEQTPFDGDLRGQGWPAAAPEVRRCVVIDFAADPAEIARQDPLAFTAVKPVGPYYEDRDRGGVAALQATIRRSVKGADGR
jgi:hypothetical protein